MPIINTVVAAAIAVGYGTALITSGKMAWSILPKFYDIIFAHVEEENKKN